MMSIPKAASIVPNKQLVGAIAHDPASGCHVSGRWRDWLREMVKPFPQSRCQTIGFVTDYRTELRGYYAIAERVF